MRIEHERREKMNWISRLERRFGRFAIPNLMYVIIILYAVGFLLNILNPYFYIQYLSLNVSRFCMDRFGGLLPFDPAAVGQCDIFAGLHFTFTI